MKKLSFVFFFIFIYSILSPISACAFSNDTFKYDIQVECFKNSEDMEELDTYKKSLLRYLNSKIKYWNKSYGKTDKTEHSYLSYDDIDFKNESKIYGLKYHGKYTEYESDAMYDSLVKSLNDDYQWRMVIKHDDVYINFILYKSDEKESHSYNIGGKWYAASCYVNDTIFHYNSPKVIRNNMQRMLTDSNETARDIKLVFVVLDKINYAEGAVVFVNGKAKYFYAYGMDFPRAGLREDTPQAVKDVISETASAIGKNSNNRDTNTKRLYSYNMIMAFYRLCAYYSK